MSISGEAKVGSELKATVTDDDGVPTTDVKYQWFADGKAIDGATNSTFTLTAAQKGAKITVQATYDDNAKNHESPTSAETPAVSEDTPPQPNEPGITLTGSKEVTEGGKATYTVSLDHRALPQANSAAELLHNLQSHKGILFGQQRGLDVAFSPENSEGHHSDVHALSGHYPSIIGLGMMEPPMVRGLSNEENGKRMGEAIKKIDGVGGIAQLSAFWDMPGGETDRTKVDLKRLLPGGDQNAELNGWLDAIVETGKHAVRDDGTKIPFIFRPLHEANGEWAWWYYERGGAETYKELFRYVVNYLKEHGLDGQFLTAFAPNGNFNGDESRYKLLYPGDDVVDVLSMDSYDTNNALLAKDKWAGELVEDMAMLARMAAAHGKVAALAEFGMAGDKMIQPSGNSDLTFYTDLLHAIKADPDAAKIAYMMTWANWGGNPGKDYSAFTPWPGHEMEADFKAFANEMTLTRNAGQDITVDVTIEHGTTDDGDVKTTTHTVTIPKGQNSATFTVDAIADGKPEGDEHYAVRISKAQGGQIEAGKDSVTTTIHDEGSAPPANHAGTVTISGEAKEDTSLTATVADEDGVPNGVHYQWLRDGKPIDGAHQKTYVLRPDDVGHKISVRASYTDNAAHDEAPTSSETDAVIAKQAQPQQNHAGTVSINGTLKVGETLTAAVADEDGVPKDVQYQWLRDGQPIDGATAKTYQLTAADAGHKISVQASYDDNAAHHETPTSSASDIPAAPPVANLTANLTGASAVSEGSTAHYRVELDLSPVGKTTGAAALLQQLKDLAAHKQTLFGQQHAIDESARGDSANDGYGRKSDVAAMSGKYPAVFGFDSDEEPAEHGKTPEENGKALAKAFIEADSLGATVTLSSHLKNPVTGGSAFDTSKVEAQRLISGDLQSKLHDWLDTVATAANNAVRADGSKVPVIFRPLHENTGDWFWWGKGHMSADDYKALWQHIHKYLEDKGVDNLLYAYSPNGSLGGDKAKYLEAYPGDNYVDIFGYDAYQSEPQARQSDAAWRSQTVRDLEMVTKLAGEHGKVAAFTEFGLNNDRVIQPSGNENTQFFSELLGAIKGSDAASQLAYMMTWANWGVDENGKFQSYTPWPGHEMEGDFKKFLDGLTLAKMPEKDVTVDIALQHGTTDDSDAKLSTERVTIAKGQSGADFTVEALADGKKEGDETYTVKITHADGANIGKENLATTIHDGSANSAPLEHHEPQLQHDDGAAAGADNAAHDANHAIAHAQDDNSTASLHIGDGIDPATYAKLVSLDNAELLQYLGEHSGELLAATQHQGAHEQHGGSGDDTLVATHGTTLQEGGAGADTFAYLLDGGDTLHWQGASTITDYNPGEGDRIVLKHGAGWQVESVDFDPATQNLTIKATHGAQTYSNTVHIHAHDGHHFNTEEILNAVTIL